MFQKSITSLLLVISLPLMAQIETQQKPTDQDHSLSLGLAAVIQESIYINGESQTRFFPAVNYKYKQFYFQAGKLGFHLIENNNWKLDVGLGANLAGDVDRGDSNLLQDMPGLSIPISAFISTQYKSTIGLFELGYEKEINNKHNGNSAFFSYSAAIRKGQWLFVPKISANYFSDEAINYFYGVPAAFTRPDRPLYTASSEINYQAGIFVIRPIGPKFSLFANLNYDIYGDEITNSPIVNEDKSLSFFTGFTYKIF